MVGVSIGACINNDRVANKEDLLRSADAAMYEAKRAILGLVEGEK
jgi:GGDEF domain-containing protein